METTVEKKQTAFRLSKSLLERLHEEARREHRSMNNLVEILLNRALDGMHRPNAETLAAMEEAKAGKYAGVIDTSSFEAFMKSLEDIE